MSSQDLMGFVAGAFGAWNQAGLLVGAGLCLLIGGLLLGSRLLLRLRAQRVEGELIGVRETGPRSWSAVYRCTDAAGITRELTSDTGSSALPALASGAQVPLLLAGGHPERCSEADSWFAEIAGAVLLGAGATLGWIALTRWPVTGYTAAALLIVAGVGMHRLAARARGGPPSELRSRQDVRAQAPLQTLEALRARAGTVSGRPAAPAWLRWLMLLAGTALVGAGLYLGRELLVLQHEGVRTAGRVLTLERRQNGSSTTWHAVVGFTAGEGTMRFTDRQGSNPPELKPGDAVEVLYRPAEPARSAIVDRGVWNWIWPLAVGAFGLLLLALGGRSLRGADPAS